MNEKEKEDIFFDIAMQLYDEFNDKFCEIDDNLGTVYTYQDLEDLKQAEKDKEIKLLRKAIKKQQAEIETLKRDFEIVDHECSRLEKEDIKKDKIIDYMAGEIACLNYEVIGEWCKTDECLQYKKNKYHQRDCDTNNIDCIKQYFNQKIEKGE